MCAYCTLKVRIGEERQPGLTKNKDDARVLPYRSLLRILPRAFSFSNIEVECITLKAILGAQDEGILVPAFERVH